VLTTECLLHCKIRYAKNVLSRKFQFKRKIVSLHYYFITLLLLDTCNSMLQYEIVNGSLLKRVRELCGAHADKLFNDLFISVIYLWLQCYSVCSFCERFYMQHDLYRGQWRWWLPECLTVYIILFRKTNTCRLPERLGSTEHEAEMRADTNWTKRALRTTEMRTLPAISGITLKDTQRSNEIRKQCDRMSNVVRWSRGRKRVYSPSPHTKTKRNRTRRNL